MVKSRTRIDATDADSFWHDFRRNGVKMARSQGATRVECSRNRDKPNQVIIESEWKSQEDFDSFSKDAKFLQLLESHGVKSKPVNEFMKELRSSPGWLMRFLIRPIGCPTFLIYGGFLLLCFNGCWQPGYYYLTGLVLTLFFWLPLIAFFAVRAGIQLLLQYLYPDFHIARRAMWGRWLAVFAIPFVLNVLIGFRVPLQLGFRTIKPNLDWVVQHVESGEKDDPRSYVSDGLYTFGDVRVDAHRIEFVLADDPEAAFVYCASGIENVPTSGAKGHLTGNWYWRKDD